MDEPVYAVLIGAETYRADGTGDVNWDLNGPANDVLAIAGCLTRMGVVPERIHFLVSALVPDRFIEDVAQTCPGAHQHGRPTRDGVTRVFETELLEQVKSQGHATAPGVMFVYWSGHGAVDQLGTDNERRLVFCADRLPGGHGVVSVSSLINSLGAALPTFRIVLVVDACAVDVNRLRMDDTIVEREFPMGRKRHPRSQPRYMVYSASPGQIALNMGSRGVGLFGEIFADELRLGRTGYRQHPWTAGLGVGCRAHVPRHC